jgi:hypothetical protein
MHFLEYLRRCTEEKRDHPNLRMGQVYYNVYYNYKPKSASFLRSVNFDPSYDDNLIGKFLYEVCATWDDHDR